MIMEKDSFKKYVLNATKEYKYRLKFAFELTDAHIERIEKVLNRYSLVDITPAKRLIVQRNPVDFKNIENSEVYYVDTITKYPASVQILSEELRLALGVAEKYVIVRTQSDPYEAEIENTEKYANDQKKNETVIGVKFSDPYYLTDGKPDANKNGELAGNEYNKNMLDAMKDDGDTGIYNKGLPADTKKSFPDNFNKDIGKTQKNMFSDVSLPPLYSPNKK